MMTANEYWKFARECTRWAYQTEDAEHRKAFLDMAKVWTQLALTVAKPVAADDSERRLAS